MRNPLHPGLPDASWRALFLLAVAWAVQAMPSQAADSTPRGRKPPKTLPGAAVFSEPTVHQFRITLSPGSLESLRQDARKPAPATVQVGDLTFTNVGIHVKGAAGSFRHIDDRPALTLAFNRFSEGRKWNGLRKVHLNNSVQDDSFMHEYLASALFRAAGVPTPRVAYAVVELNQRALGLYVLKEGWTDDFLKCFFEKTDGNLYDGGFVRDVDGPLELDQGKGPKDQSDLARLEETARSTPRTNRWERLRHVLDVDRFARYLAVSTLLADWDGYALNRNNYRIYFDPGSGLAVFMPHGMDQVLQRPDMELQPWFNGLVAQGFIQTPEGKALYQRYCHELFAEHFRFEPLTNTIQRLADTLRPWEPEIDLRASHLRQRLKSRIRYLTQEEELGKPGPSLASPPG